MNKKVIIYFVSAIVLLFSVSAYFISKDMHINENSYKITGEYDIWISGTSGDDSGGGLLEQTAETAASETIPETSAVTEERYLYVNINTAAKEELMLLKGIGDVLSENILNYRLVNGGFRNIEEIMNVKGIGEKKFLAMKDHIYVENPVYTYYSGELAEESETGVIDVSGEESGDSDMTEQVRYDLNKVTMEELESVPGLSREMAESIISLRENIKYFSNTYELLYADGMTEERLRRIIDYFYV